jgi:hypothetical protein
MKRLLWAIPLIIVASSVYADQSVYIDQVSGDNLIFDVIQRNGDGNKVGDPSAPSPYLIIDGSNQTITVLQDGSSNKLTGTIEATTLSFNITNTGDSNLMDFIISNGDSSDYLISYTGSGNELSWTSGSSVSSSYADIDYDIIGDYNIFTIGVESDGAKQDLTYSGDSNEVTITQIGYGSAVGGHIIIHNLVGDSNIVDITQETTLAASVINLDTNGSNQTITITQSD